MNKESLHVDIVTEFPEMVSSYLGQSMLGRATRMGAWDWSIVNPRDFAPGKRHTTDDRPYGGGPGMVMLADPLMQAVESVQREGTKVIMMAPTGKPFKQADARRLAKEKHLVFICGHYEGMDERVRMLLQPEEFSIGDYVLTNGALAAAVVIDATVRLLPGVLGGEGATEDESFESGLLEFPQYTHPPVWRGLKVPDVLQGGDHTAIAKWRKASSEVITLARRPDLAAAAGLPNIPVRKRKRGGRGAVRPAKTKHLVYLDFDDVIGQTCLLLAQFANREYGRNVVFDEIRAFDLHVSMNLNDVMYDDFMRRFHIEELGNIEPMPGAVDVMKQWLRDGIRPVVVTGRPPYCRPETEAWLDAHGLGDVEVVFVNKYGRLFGPNDTSVPFPDLAQRGFLCAVDDAPASINLLSRSGMCPFFVFERPWNRDWTPPEDAHPASPATRVTSWTEIDEHVRALAAAAEASK